ncbi:Tafazzin [Bienertia sinuspersici]
MVGNQYQYHHWIDRADLLKSNARFLKLQLRQRFRVAVDRHFYRRHYSLSSTVDGRVTAVVKRWLHRFRDFRRHSLSSSSASASSAFSRIKRVKRDIYAEEESAIFRMLQSVAAPLLGNVCHVFMHGLNRVQVYGAEKLLNALQCKSKEKPLITVSNHVASMDDPLVIASLLPPSVLMDAQNLRWTLCATDRCFKNPITSAFFRSVKVLPVSRGDGIYQKGLDLAVNKLNDGGWVHIFPEGSRSRDGGRTVGTAKRGVGRLVVDADKTPIVIPFVHTGMQEIIPIGASFPRIGKTVTVLIGDPVEFDDLLNAEETELSSRGNLYDAVSTRVGERLKELKLQVDKLAVEKPRQMKEYALQGIGRAAEILQQLDWESFGMNSHISYQDDSEFSKLQRQNKEVILSHQEDSVPENYSMTQFSDGGIMSKIQSHINSTEFMGFAARGVLLNQLNRVSEVPRQLNPLRAWKQYLEDSYGARVNLC